MTDDDNFMRTWTTDAHNNRVRVGLTLDETAELDVYIRQYKQGATETPDDRQRYFELRNKHEFARLAVIGAENQARIDKPTSH